MRTIQINNQQSSPNFKARLDGQGLKPLNSTLKKIPSEQRDCFYKAMNAGREEIRALKIDKLEPFLGIKKLKGSTYTVSAHLPNHPKIRSKAIELDLSAHLSGEELAKLLMAKFTKAVEDLKNARSYVNFKLAETTQHINR